MALAEIAERVWYGEDAGARVARAALAPFEALFRAGVAVRGALYDRGVRTVHPLAIPALSVGNLTVGGTGKTPVAAWFGARLRALGASPALVLRGVGGDEARVHALLNPDVPVVADPDRVRGAEAARARGADVVVLDDAFQHRRAARVVDVVLVSAERGAAPVHLLPRGPYREGASALARADVVVVTRKCASLADAERVRASLVAHSAAAGATPPSAIVHLAPDRLRRWAQSDAPVPDALDVPALHALAGTRILAVAGIGEPGAFAAQLRASGAAVTLVAFGDHHAYTAADAAALARRGADVDHVVCTLKDAVKLGPLWPRGAPPLWYVSQRVVVERGAELLDGLLHRLLAARRTARAPESAAPPAPSVGARSRALGTDLGILPAGDDRPE